MTVLRVLGSRPDVEPSLRMGNAVLALLGLVPIDVKDQVIPPLVVMIMVVYCWPAAEVGAGSAVVEPELIDGVGLESPILDGVEAGEGELNLELLDVGTTVTPVALGDVKGVKDAGGALDIEDVSGVVVIDTCEEIDCCTLLGESIDEACDTISENSEPRSRTARFPA